MPDPAAQSGHAGSGTPVPDPPATEVTAPKAGGRFILASVFAALWTIGLLVLVAAKTQGLSQVAAGIGSVVTVAVAVVGMFQPVRAPAIDRRVLSRTVAALLVADISGSVGWALWSYHRANATVDVTALAALTPHQAVSPGHSATFDVDVTKSRTTLVVTFQAVDTYQGIGSCTSATHLSATSVTAAGQGAPVTVTLGVPARFHLVPHSRHVQLSVKVLNIHDDTNCAVDLSVSSATLVND